MSSLQSGDVITALFQPLSFTALGATGKNDEINFETQAFRWRRRWPALGVSSMRASNPSGVFLFRLEQRSETAGGQGADAVATPTTTAQRLGASRYRVDLKDPRSLFWIQSSR